MKINIRNGVSVVTLDAAEKRVLAKCADILGGLSDHAGDEISDPAAKGFLALEQLAALWCEPQPEFPGKSTGVVRDVVCGSGSPPQSLGGGGAACAEPPRVI